MVIDFHTHIFPPDIQTNRGDYFSSEPAFRLLYESPKAKIIGAEEMIQMMDDQGIERSVVFGFPWTGASRFQTHNDYVVEAVARHPDRLIGFGCFDPFHPDAVSETERCLDAGLSGIGELAFYHTGFGEKEIRGLEPIMDICRTRDVPVLIHTNEPLGHEYPGKTPNTLSQIYLMVKRFPANKIVLAHWGGGLFFYFLLKKEVGDILKNTFFDTAASPYLYDPDIFSIAVQTAGVDRILFGSDFPLIKPERYFKQMEAAGLTESDRKQICGTNASILLKIDVGP